MDPFSANSKAIQPPPAYQWRSPPRTPDRARHTTTWSHLPTPPSEQRPVLQVLSSSSPLHTPSRRSSESRIWEDALENALMGPDASGQIDLQNQQLTYIPSFITDLDKLVILPVPAEAIPREDRRMLGRVRSAPMARITSKRTLARSPTISKMFAPGHARVASLNQDEKVTEVNLLLGSNIITKLPSEIFRIRGLTVLSLRSNRIRRLPAAVSELVNLEELNLSNNRLEYLPSEALLIGLKKLFLNANPLIEPPEADDATVMRSRLLGPLVQLQEDVLSLRELALRVLFSRPDPALRSQSKTTRDTTLETIYELPIPSTSLSADLIAKINPSLPPSSRSRPPARVPSIPSFSQVDRRTTPLPQPLLPSALSEAQPIVKSSVLEEDSRLNDACYDAKFNKCPNTSSAGRCGELVFFDHAEERMEWVSTLAEDVVSDLKGGLVPILWRGCSRGCLDFLDPRPSEGEAAAQAVPFGVTSAPVMAGMAVGEDWDDFELDP
ncbi:hypothetical protein FRB96_001671 [Tulasnella sp. 330]|nr:hypothetical protein FRB96_001671 [Tulasnella sp. 330]KAG8888138.1 hypothetical protein FRB98_008330 [Tulasnella sp. 332]